MQGHAANMRYYDGHTFTWHPCGRGCQNTLQLEDCTLSHSSTRNQTPTCEKVVMLLQVGVPCQEDTDAWLSGVSPSSASLPASTA